MSGIINHVNTIQIRMWIINHVNTIQIRMLYMYHATMGKQTKSLLSFVHLESGACCRVVLHSEVGGGRVGDDVKCPGFSTAERQTSGTHSM